MTLESIGELIADIPDFPKPGVIFKDITPILNNAKAFKILTRMFVESIPQQTTHLAAIESRGFILGAAICQHCDFGMNLVRKPGKLPRETLSESYALEYGTDTLEIHKDSLNSNDKVIIIDDVLATGGTAAATERLIKQTGAEVLGSRFLLEISSLKGGDKLRAEYQSFFKV